MITSFATGKRSLEKAKTITRFLYYFLAFRSLSILFGRGQYASQEGNFSPIWSIKWAELLNFPDVINIIVFFFLISAFVGALFNQLRVGRVIAFLGVFQLHAFLSSFIQVDHQWYPWLYVTFLLIFLPDAPAQEYSFEKRKKFLLVFFGAQAAIFTIYSMAGFGKTYGAIEQFLQGGVHAFAPEALALHIAHWLVANNSTSLVGSFIIAHPLVGWPFFVGSIYLLLFSLWAVFKPSLHRLWAFGLLLYHIGVYAAMNISFLGSPLLLLLLFFDSPFKKRGVKWKEIILDLPLFGWLLRRLN
ncbi:MAG: hypothetical protein KJI72_01500 [Patescibacteria group bacterium]|nr:hypothetical protein [Patescibacteria group bacterium]